MGSRRKARELALQFLYQIEITRGDLETTLGLFWAEHPVGPEIRGYASELIRGTQENLDKIDPLLSRYAHNWILARMAAVDRNVLRLAVYEMLFSKHAPPIVVINEAVDIVKKYSTPDSGAFVNGILDQIRKEEMKDAP
jgi:transcription antitermination protein NusB